MPVLVNAVYVYNYLTLFGLLTINMIDSLTLENGWLANLFYHRTHRDARSLAKESKRKTDEHEASDTLENFLSKVAFESDFRKKTCTCVMKTFAIFLLSKETFTITTCSILERFFRKLLSKATFERKLFSVSLP